MTEMQKCKQLSPEDVEKMKSILGVAELPSRSEELTDEQKQKLIKGGFDSVVAGAFGGTG